MSLSQKEQLKLQELFADVSELHSASESEFDPLSFTGSDGETCLHIAASRSDVDAILLLTRAGLSVNVEDKHRRTPLDYALEQHSGDAVCVLIEQGGAPSKRKDLVRQWIKGVSGL